MYEVKTLILFGVLAIASAYEIGTTNKYSYETTVAVNEKCGLESDSVLVGQRLKAKVHLTSVWESPEDPSKKLLKIEILNLKLLVPKKAYFEEHGSELDKLSSGPSYVLWDDDTPKRIWDDPKEHFSLRNLKRGIGSFLQFRKKDQDGKEIDISGECDVIYKVKENFVRRRKGNCIHPRFDHTLSQPHGVRSATTYHQSTVECDWTKEPKQTIFKCSVVEYVKMFSNTWHRPSLCVDTKSELVFEGVDNGQEIYKKKEIENVIEELKMSQEIELEGGDLSGILNQEEKPKRRQLKPSVNKQHEKLKTENLAQLKSAVAFYKLLPVFRSSTKGEILQLLNNEKLEDIRNQILDLVSACATPDCLKAGFEFFEDEKEYSLTLERFVISLSILPRPGAFVLKELKSFIVKIDYEQRIEASLLATLGTLLKTYAENHAIVDKEFVEEIRLFLENGMKKCDQDSESCVLNYLRSLRNAARPRSAPLLLEYATRGGKEALEAVLALRSIPEQSLPPESQATLLKVFNQVGRKQDRSTRALAAELLLRQHPGSDVLKSIFISLSDQSDLEFSTFLTSKIMHMISLDKELRASVLKILPEKEISYYYSLAQSGQSSLFTRPLLFVEGTNVTYGIEMEMLNGGLLKRSVFDVSFENLAGGSSLLTVGIFAEGLGAVAGDDSGEDDASPTAGMELGILGSSLRPYVFFKNTAELMSHAWSGTASEQTPVLQCILAFSDDEKIVVLSNGMVVRGQLRGVLSTDSSASVTISLWNRNSQSLVKNEGALLVRGSVAVDTGFANLQGAIQFTGESGIDFRTDLDFYESPFNICLQMEHPDIKIKFDVHRSISLQGTKYHLRRIKKRTINIPGRSFALHERNNEMCQILNSEP